MTARSITGNLLIIAAVLAATAVARPADRDLPDPAAAERLTVRTHTGDVVFHVSRPDDVASPAWRDDVDAPGAPAAAYELSNRVIVRSARPPRMPGAAADRAALAVESVAAVPGFWIVTAGSVAEAVETASLLAADPQLDEVYLDISAPKVLREVPTDPNFPDQWHLQNDEMPIADANVVLAWDAGYKGVGVTIGILEGGWQYDHPDLAANYNADATQAGGSATGHGTSCAGVAAAVAFNDQGGVGAAYAAQVSGQIYGGSSQTASAFLYRNDLNDIKNNSWGPPDDGRITYMTSLERTALEDSVAAGRDGLGEIFVWAAGNGGTGDRIDYDPYASSRLTCAIGGIGDLDVRSSFNETGSSMLAVAHTSGNVRSIFTTTNGSGYTSFFGGTSSAAPLAAGVIALMLDANPQLTWRDVQHVLVNSARVCDPDNPDWTTNAAGHDINYNYGFGAVDAEAAVALAAQWENVDPEVVYDSGAIIVDGMIPDADTFGWTENLQVEENIRIESVELILHVTTTYVGDLRIVLTGPQGTTSLLADDRNDSQDNYNNYIFTSLRHWDEESAGTWAVNIADLRASNQAYWDYYRLKIYGTPIPPDPLGDLNCDGAVDAYDIDGFICAVSSTCDYEGMYPDCDRNLADCNGDGNVNAYDIDAFIALLGGG